MSALYQIIIGALLVAVCSIGVYYGGHLFVSGVKNWGKEPESTHTIQRDEVFNKLPLFDFTVKREHQAPNFYEEALYITNKGEGKAINVSIDKFPLPDNKQKVAISGQQNRVNEIIRKKVSLLDLNESVKVFNERGYNGKQIRVQITFRNIYNLFFAFKYEGEISSLRLVERLYISKETGDKVRF